jgi:hypothetical protein
VTVVFDDDCARHGARSDNTERRASSKQRPSIEWGSGWHNVTL